MTATSRAEQLRAQKRRRRSLDESLINPLKALVVSARLRRQSTTDATGNFERNILYSSDRRRKRSDNDEFLAQLPFQNTTKERLRSAVVTRSASLKDNDGTATTYRRASSNVLRRLSRHFARHSFSECDERRRNSIHEIPNENDENQTKTKMSSNTFRDMRQQFDRMSFDASSLSTVDSGIDTREDKNIISSDEFERISDESGDNSDAQENEKDAYTPPLRERSLSTNDVIYEPDTVIKGVKPIKRQHSYNENLCSAGLSSRAVIMRRSEENINSILYYSDNLLPKNPPKKLTKSKSPKKKILKPLVSRIRKSSKNTSISEQQQHQKLEPIDNQLVERIVTDTLEGKLRDLQYDHLLSRERCRLLSSTLEQTLRLRLATQPQNAEYKITALVFIGETRDDGICFATQCSFEPTKDLFGTGTFQNDTMYVCASVLCTLLNNKTDS